MATGTLRDFSLYLTGLGSVFRSSALGTVAVQLTSDHRGNLGGVFNANDNLVWARQSLSVAAGTTGADQDANSVADLDTGITQNFARWVGVVLANTTNDSTARFKLEGGGANPVLFPISGWTMFAWGYDTSGRNFPAYQVHPAGSVITGTTADQYRWVTNTPTTATTLTAELIIFGTSS